MNNGNNDAIIEYVLYHKAICSTRNKQEDQCLCINIPRCKFCVTPKVENRNKNNFFAYYF